VPFVKTGNECGSQKRDDCPTRGPFHVAHGRQSGAPGAEEQDTQNRVADNVAGLADVEVPMMKLLPVQSKEKMQKRIKNPAGIVGGEQRARFDSDDDQPEGRGDPAFQKFVAVVAQARSGSWTKIATVLLDAIVGRLAGDHHVVHVALAKPGAADAHEARFLQKLSNGGAAAVAHA